jgi:predicted nucleic acid-binding protein
MRGITLHIMDAFIAATAIAHEQILVTRNVKDFVALAEFRLQLLNPWTNNGA